MNTTHCFRSYFVCPNLIHENACLFFVRKYFWNFNLFVRLQHFSRNWKGMMGRIFASAQRWLSTIRWQFAYIWPASKRNNNDEIIYKFNRGYEFTSHFTMCVQSAPDDIQCSMAMQPISIGKKWPGAHTVVEWVENDGEKKGQIDVLAGMITVLNVVCR